MKKLILLMFAMPLLGIAQVPSVSISGNVKDQLTKAPLPYVNVILKNPSDSSFYKGTITSEEGRFMLAGVNPGNYLLELSFVGYHTRLQPLFAGSLSAYLDLATIELAEKTEALNEVTVTARQDEAGSMMDKKTFSIADNISQSGGSVLQAMQNLPGVTIQDGKVQLRGSDKITVLIDGRQTALTGFGSQTGLDNIPASAIDKIEIINNPTSRYDANGNAGIINIIYKTSSQQGFNGKAGVAGGLGALWIKHSNLPTVGAQYQATPKLNPSLSLNYRKNKINAFFQGDYLYTRTLNKNEFVDRHYDDGTLVRQQTRRNRITSLPAAKAGIDLNLSDNDLLTVSGFFSSEKIIDRGDQPFFNANLSERLRMWQFLEDELKTTAMASAAYQHKFKEAGHQLSAGFNYTFHREDEKYFFTNTMPTFIGKDAFKLISDEHVADLTLDYTRPLRHGRFESGMKFRRRVIPTDMLFIPGLNSPLDVNAGGAATYKETIPALYGTYVFENPRYEVEAGLRLEYVALNYEVNPNHNTYKTDGYHYMQPFPNIRLAYKINEQNKVSFFYNRRVDRPNEVDIRIFPKYDDAEIIKIGNPALRPQFTNSFELGYKTGWEKGYLYTAAYHRMADGTITRISSVVPGSNLIYAIFQNARRSYNTGLELLLSQQMGQALTLSLNTNIYRNIIDAFTVENKYPENHSFTAARQQITSGNIKLSGTLHLPGKTDAQIVAVYLAPDIIPQGKIGARFSIDAGIKKATRKGEVFVNATDLLNTMVIRKEILGNGFNYISRDYYETQVIRMGYNHKF